MTVAEVRSRGLANVVPVQSDDDEHFRDDSVDDPETPEGRLPWPFQ